MMPSRRKSVSVARLFNVINSRGDFFRFVLGRCPRQPVAAAFRLSSPRDLCSLLPLPLVFLCGPVPLLPRGEARTSRFPSRLVL
jgi:hypothetical protein